MSHNKTMDKLLGRKKIEKLTLNLMDKTDEDFRKGRLKHIKDWMDAGKSKDWAEVDFDQKYPNKMIWNAQTGATMSAYGEQSLIDKVNEIIDQINEL